MKDTKNSQNDNSHGLPLPPLSLTEVTNFFRATHAVAPELAPAMAFKLFAPLRASEVFRHTQRCLEADKLQLSASISKTGKAKIISVSPTLLACLALFPEFPAQATSPQK